MTEHAAVDREAIRQRWRGLAEGVDFGRGLQLDGEQSASLAADFRALLEAPPQPELQPGRWFRILAPDGSLWMETSDGDEARAESARCGWPLERLWFAEISEWRKDES